MTLSSHSCQVRFREINEIVYGVWRTKHWQHVFPAAVFLSDFCSEEMDRLDKTASSSNELYDAEADCYWCLCKVLDYIQENYTFAQPGVQKTCFHFSEVRRIHRLRAADFCDFVSFFSSSFVNLTTTWIQLVKLLDGDLHQHLKQEVSICTIMLSLTRCLHVYAHTIYHPWL